MIMRLLVAFIGGTLCFAEANVSTIAERQKAIEEAFKGASIDDAIASINKQQQDNSLTTNPKNYIVILQKGGDKYVRVAHRDKEKVGKEIEESLKSMIEEAEKNLGDGSGPVAYEGSIHALVSKQGDLLIFNIAQTKEEVDQFFNGGKDDKKLDEPKGNASSTQPTTPEQKNTTDAKPVEVVGAKEETSASTEEKKEDKNPDAGLPKENITQSTPLNTEEKPAEAAKN